MVLKRKNIYKIPYKRKINGEIFHLDEYYTVKYSAENRIKLLKRYSPKMKFRIITEIIDYDEGPHKTYFVYRTKEN